MKRTSFWVLVLKGLVGLHRTVQLQLLQLVTDWGIDLDYCDIEWFYGDLQDLLELTPKKISFALKGTGMQK